MEFCVQKSVNIQHIKLHYFTSHANLNYYGIVPVGCDAWWEGAHNRDVSHPVA